MRGALLPSTRFLLSARKWRSFFKNELRKPAPKSSSSSRDARLVLVSAGRMTIGRRRVSALPPISRRDFISHGQFRKMLKHTCAAARLAPRCARERADSRKRERAHVLRPRRHAPAPSALARRLDNLEPQLSASQRSFIASILVRAARARVRGGTARAAMRPQFARSFAATRVPPPPSRESGAPRSSACGACCRTSSAPTASSRPCSAPTGSSSSRSRARPQVRAGARACAARAAPAPAALALPTVCRRARADSILLCARSSDAPLQMKRPSRLRSRSRPQSCERAGRQARRMRMARRKP